MKKLSVITSIFFATLLLSFKAVENTSWSLDTAHAKLSFTVTHLTISDVEGSFKVFQATVTSQKADFTDALVTMTAGVSSLNTDNDQRDGYLKSADFFDATKYPTIEFKSTSFKPTKTAGIYEVKGNLTMRGISKPVTLSAIAKTGINPQNQKTIAGFKILGKINRKDFGIGSSMPAAIVGEDVEIFANAEFVKN
jgi:polyisoprenoid-binding protein YceI